MKPGDRVRAVEKAQGIKRGEKMVPLGVIEIVSNTKVVLNTIDRAECVREGFSNLAPHEFVSMFCKCMKVEPDKIVNRIEFRHVD